MKKLLIIFLLLFNFVSAETTNVTASVRWNNDNFHTALHPQVVSFSIIETGYVVDMADDTQIIYTWLFADLLRGDWQDAYFHVCRGQFYFSEDLKELSICLSKL